MLTQRDAARGPARGGWAAARGGPGAGGAASAGSVASGPATSASARAAWRPGLASRSRAKRSESPSLPPSRALAMAGSGRPQSPSIAWRDSRPAACLRHPARYSAAIRRPMRTSAVGRSRWRTRAGSPGNSGRRWPQGRNPPPPIPGGRRNGSSPSSAHGFRCDRSAAACRCCRRSSRHSRDAGRAACGRPHSRPAPAPVGCIHFPRHRAHRQASHPGHDTMLNVEVA